MNHLRQFSTLLFLCLLPVFVQAQSKVKGAVIDYNTQKGIGDCNVYLSGTSKGSFTNAKGFFEISNVPDGIYELVFSHVNYKAHVEIIEVKGQDVSIKSSLILNPTALNSVVVTNEKDRAARRRALKRFKEFFFGKQYLESNIFIKNEDIIDLSKEKDGIIESKNPYVLQVENNYLGYDLEYYVKQFLLSSGSNMVLGFPKFTAQDSKNPTQELMWMENRQRAYNGSLRHFFAALLKGELKESGFEAFLTRDDPEVIEEEKTDFYEEQLGQKIPIDSKKLPISITINDTEFDNIKEVNFAQIVEVNYTKEFGKVGGYQNSKFKMVKDYIYIYTNGVVVNPSAIKLFGQWADEGTYELLPYDFVSNDTLVLEDNAERQLRLAQLNKLAEEQPIEKVYLHTNRSDYYPDETIWFKAYAVAGPLHQPSPLSHNIYVDLLDPDQKVLKQLMLISEEGFAHGSIELEKGLKEGSYVLQAYTQSMKDGSPEYFFRKEISVNSIRGATSGIKKAEDIDLQLFPEGGYLVDNLASTVAFKAIDEHGMPVPVNGKVFNGADEQIAQFFTRHDGMGTFSLTPQSGENYYVQLDQSAERFEIPTAETAGVTLQLDNLSSEDNLSLTIRKSSKIKAENLFLIAHARGWLNYTSSVDFVENVASMTVPKSTFREGINHLTLFDKKGNPLAERLFYSRGQSTLNIAVEPDKESYKAREITKLKIKVTDENGAPVEGNFSLTAFNTERVFQTAPNDHIVSNLLLNSDIKGYLHHPAYYFESISPAKNRNLDLVMMTHGWTRFSWDELESLVENPIEPDYGQRIDISGRMLVENSKKPVKNGTVTYINNTSENPETLVVTTNRKGEFLIEDAAPFEEQAFLLRGQTSKNGKSVQFEVDLEKREIPSIPLFKEVTLQNPPATSEDDLAFDPNEGSGLTTSPSVTPFLAKDNKDYLSTLQILETVVVEAEKEEPKRLSLYGPPSFSMDVTDAVRSYAGTNVLKFLKGRLPGVLISDNDVASTIEIRTVTMSTATLGDGEDTGGFLPLSSVINSNENNPMLFLDNVPVTIEIIAGLPASIIERVEVFKGPDAAAFGANGIKGAMMFFTKPGVSAFNYVKTKGIQAFTVAGYHIAKDFYVPQYDVDYQETGVPDYRIAIHWQPVIKTNEQGEATVSFYNSDDLNMIKVLIEGISLDGVPGIGNCQYEVINRE
ncbi:MAG: TonB-dependent receptor plug domain-containing protein [Roseivirga sp.]|nr:TonB-dependent receptor plug domain-containing protein [Roseivirga sp.]